MENKGLDEDKKRQQPLVMKNCLREQSSFQ